jgi:hypothetical protein
LRIAIKPDRMNQGIRSGKPGKVLGESGIVSGKPAKVSGKPGNVSGEPGKVSGIEITICFGAVRCSFSEGRALSAALA